MADPAKQPAFEPAPAPPAPGGIAARALAARSGATSYLDKMNPEQREAVETLDGPVLVLAGAGTGKTRVLTTRIAHILSTGRARPGDILAVTFTNKAAREMKERIGSMIGQAVEGMPWLGTFHSIGVKVLRRHAELVGLKSDFTILDTDDQIRLLKQLLAAEGIDEKRWPARHLAGLIDHWKNRGLTPDLVPAGEGAAFANGRGKKLYQAFQERLKVLNAADFGDLLLEMIRLYREHPDVLAQYQRRFRYILVDEYQDTNVAQYLWLRLLSQKPVAAAPKAGGLALRDASLRDAPQGEEQTLDLPPQTQEEAPHPEELGQSPSVSKGEARISHDAEVAQHPPKNICCVGDDDQSIYGWRGAEVDNILRFEHDFPGAKVIRLERNYRSTGHILAAASYLIAHNEGRLGKTLRTEDIPGEKVTVTGSWDSEEEARSVGEEIEQLQRAGLAEGDADVLVLGGFDQQRADQRAGGFRAVEVLAEISAGICRDGFHRGLCGRAAERVENMLQLVLKQHIAVIRGRDHGIEHVAKQRGQLLVGYQIGGMLLERLQSGAKKCRHEAVDELGLRAQRCGVELGGQRLCQRDGERAQHLFAARADLENARIGGHVVEAGFDDRKGDPRERRCWFLVRLPLFDQHLAGQSVSRKLGARVLSLRLCVCFVIPQRGERLAVAAGRIDRGEIHRSLVIGRYFIPVVADSGATQEGCVPDLVVWGSLRQMLVARQRQELRQQIARVGQLEDLNVAERCRLVDRVIEHRLVGLLAESDQRLDSKQRKFWRHGKPRVPS